MPIEQTDFFDKLADDSGEEKKPEFGKTEEKGEIDFSEEPQKVELEPKDDLGFKCEICQDVGCPSCGFGRNQ